MKDNLIYFDINIIILYKVNYYLTVDCGPSVMYMSNTVFINPYQWFLPFRNIKGLGLLKQ